MKRENNKKFKLEKSKAVSHLLSTYLREQESSRRNKFLASTLQGFRSGSEKVWIKRGEDTTLELFRAMAAHVPAYKDFLKKNKINPKKIVTPGDLTKLPVTNKENYLQSYPLEALCWGGKFKDGSWMISSTSGSTGQPFYFPRSHLKDKEFQMTAELAFREYYQIHKKSTLFLDCFALGVWIGGMFMYQTVRNLMNTGDYALSIITPGADRSETLKAIRRLAPQFDQVILGGYGPLVKDLIDDGIHEGIDWNQYNMKYFFAAEGFTEGFRDYLHNYGGAKNVFTGTLNHYGTADLGTMAHETPLSILIRSLVVQNKKMFTSVFSQAHRLPTLAQFIPELFFFEQHEGRLLCSGLGGLPLMHYDLKDRGEVVTFEEMITRCKEGGIDILREARKEKLDTTIWKLPFVYLYERDDFTVSIYSVNIYPESIRRALEVSRLEKSLTGKFTMSTEFNDQQNQVLQIVTELKTGVKENATLMNHTLQSVIATLNQENSEWRDFYADPNIRHKVIPQIIFKAHHDEDYFKPGRKQKWIKKVKPNLV